MGWEWGRQQERWSAIDRKRLFSKMEIKDNILGRGGHLTLIKHTEQEWRLGVVTVTHIQEGAKPELQIPGTLRVQLMAKCRIFKVSSFSSLRFEKQFRDICSSTRFTQM